MELFWIFVTIVIADLLTTLYGIRIGLEDIWFGRRVLPLFILTTAQIAGFYVIMLLMPLVPYMRYVVYGAIIIRVAVVVWNIYLITRERKSNTFFFPFFQRTDILAA
jgi:hypothetical protein